MIEDKQTAHEISNLMLEISEKLNNSIFSVQAICSPEEVNSYKRAVGRIMGEILLEVLNNLYLQHPDLKPKGLI